MPAQHHSIEDHYEEGKYIGEYPVEGGDGHVKSWKHKTLEVEVAVVKQHKGMEMFHQVLIAEPADEDSVHEIEASRISGDMKSSSAAIEEAKHWMRQNPMAGYKGEIRCKDCGEQIGLEINDNNFLMCDPCENYETLDEGEQSEHFEVIKENGKQPFIRGEA